MIVIYDNENYNLDLPFLLFENLKKHHPNTEVKIEQITKSNYKKVKTVEIRYLEDRSIARNKSALGLL